jgi:5-methylcytosine-specific restriction protein A
MTPVRNPTWVWDELILALDLYFRHWPHVPISPAHPDAIALSKFLNQLPIHPPEMRAPNFRNPDGVSMKTANFRAIDPEIPGVALSAVGQRDREVWAHFANDREGLHKLAVAIRRNAAAPEVENQGIENFEELEATEGRILVRLHKSRERNQTIVRSKKDLVLRDTGKLACEACGFDFRKAYGELGDGFIECHHTIPVSQLNAGEEHKNQ